MFDRLYPTLVRPTGWRNFFRLRCSPAAHPQMRQIAVPMLAEFKRLIPVVFDDLYPVAHQDGGAA